MAKKNESLGEKTLRYGKAYLFGGGAFGVGKEAVDDYKEYREQALYDEYLTPIDDAWESKDYKQVIEIADDIINEDDMDEDIVRVATWRKARGYFNYAIQRAVPNVSFQDERNRQTLDLFEESLGCFHDYGEQYGWDDEVMDWIMLIYDLLGKVADARDCAICLLDSEDRAIRTKALEVYQSNTNTLLEKCGAFTESVDYSKRKHVFLGQNIQKIGGTYQWIDDERVIDWIFTLDQLPSDMVFPLGRPKPGLYMAHPVLTDHYYPMEIAEEKLFMEKVIEFCWLVQCLGATEVSFHSDKGLSVSQGMESSRTIKADVGVKKAGVGGEYGNTQSSDEDNVIGQKVELIQRFAPQHQAYCPSNLVWLDSDPQWKMLVKQRLEGGIMEYNYKISSSETCQMSSNETNAVKANFEYMMVKVNGSYDSSTDRTFSNSEETEWSIHVEFASLEELAEHKTSRRNDDESHKKLKDFEQEYLDMVKECMEDGEIGMRERKLLDKIRVKNGISEGRAKELEATLSAPQLTDDEKEYLEAFKDACEDGVVSDKQRRLLEKLRVMYGISEERARQLEK